ncbi:MAG: hypothetical protein P4L28_11635 [Paludibacteraceae bacterium]|jgi:hypothetical protein|nr:hypothetical protein [Paludibacteraceae bacterium]
MIVFGLGSGRTGTASLSFLIGSQKNAICFHELNPTGAVFEGNPQPILNTVNEFQNIIDGGDKRLLALDYSRPASVKKYQELKAMPEIRIMGDIAYYYLRYVDDILAINTNVRFVCIKRDKAKTVDSWMKKSSLNRWPSLTFADKLRSWITRMPYHESKNFWQEHDGSIYQPDPVWDKTFPKFQAGSKKEAIEKYWDYYYTEAEVIADKHPTHFRIFPIEMMSSRHGQAEILKFIGLKDEDMELRDSFHMHKSRAHD